MYGKELNSVGIVAKEKNFFVVKKVLTAGSLIEKHNHSGKNILFTIVKGEILVYLNESEQHHLTPGTVLQFDGENFINAKALKDSQVFVTLINKN